MISFVIVFTKAFMFSFSISMIGWVVDKVFFFINRRKAIKRIKEEEMAE